MRLAYLCAQALGEDRRARAWHLARCLTRRGHRIILLSPGRALKMRCQEVEGIEMVEAPASPLRPDYLLYPLVPFFLSRQAARHGPFDVIHAFDAPLPASGRTALKLCATGRPLVVDWEEDYSQPETARRAGELERRTLAAARAVVVVSGALEERARRLGVSAERLVRIGNGADVSSPRPERAAARAALGWPADAAIMVCHVGDSSAPVLALAALRALLPAHPSLMLALVGEVPREEPSDELWNWARQQRAVRRVPPAGAAELAQYYAAADLLLLPRRATPAEAARFPLALGEYLAAGRAVVASDVGEPGRLLRERLCGVLVQNQEQFTRRIEELLTNAERRARLEQLARHTAETALDWENHADTLEALYARLAEKTKP